VIGAERIIMTGPAMAMPGPKDETLGDFHAPGDAPNGTVIVRGGQSEMPPVGTTFSGAQDATTAEAAGVFRTGTYGRRRPETSAPVVVTLR
jgi:hypothetical protein